MLGDFLGRAAKEEGIWTDILVCYHHQKADSKQKRTNKFPELHILGSIISNEAPFK